MTLNATSTSLLEYSPAVADEEYVRPYLAAIENDLTGLGLQSTGASPSDAGTASMELRRNEQRAQRRPQLKDFVSRDAPRPIAFIAVQSWEGVVEDVRSDGIYVRLFDKTNPDNPHSLAVLDADEIDREDCPLVSKGAVFYWVVGYETRPSGRRRSSFIRFRRLPVWTKREIEKIHKSVDELLSILPPLPDA